MRYSEPSIVLLAALGTMIAVLLHEFAHFLTARLVAGYWAEFLYAGVRYSEPFSRGEAIVIFGSGPIVDVLVTGGLAWFVWERRESLITAMLSIPIGITLLYLLSALIVLITQSEDADLTKLGDSIFSNSSLGGTAIFVLYFLGIAVPTRYIALATIRSTTPNLLNVWHAMLIAIGVLGGLLASLVIRELLIAF